MHARSPSSCASLSIRVSTLDACLAFAAPLLALMVRDAYILSYEGALTAALYCGVAATFSLAAFLVFRLRDQMAEFFSVHDVIDIVKAVLAAEFMTCVVLFTFTRLEGIPRSILLIHALLLMVGLIGARALKHLFHSDVSFIKGNDRTASEHIIMVGATRLSSLYIKMLQTYFPGQHQVIGVLDTNPQKLGRAIAGVRVIGSPEDLRPLIDEFAVHGIHTSRLIFGGDATILPETLVNRIERVCVERGIELDFVPRLTGLDQLATPHVRHAHPSDQNLTPKIAISRYFEFKRVFDLLASFALIILLLPLFMFVVALALIDVGFPVFFWQQRVGQDGSAFLIYKVRTLRPPFDAAGNSLPEDERISWIGTLLRRTRLDELPQLLNVLVGDMSLIGPRPLLPQDQPENSAMRLLVRPGITGWAQISGGNALTPIEKAELDEWYIHHASLWLDMRILALTAKRLLWGIKDQSAPTLAPRNMLPSVSRSFRPRSAAPRAPQRYHPFLLDETSGAKTATGE